VRWNVSVSRKVREKFTHRSFDLTPKTAKILDFPLNFTGRAGGAATA
jgi:hypothetical protein